MSVLYFDHRWCAAHGIGRFATEVRRRLVGFSDLPIGGSPTSPWDSWRLGGCLRRSNTKAFFTPGFNAPLPARCPVITTIHDLIHVHFGGETSVLKRAYYRYIQRPVVRRSPLTLTVSEYSRRQIIEWYDVPENRVVVVGNGVSEDFKEQGEAFRPGIPYFLYVGNTKPHKNVGLLIRVFAQLADQTEADLRLVTRPTHALRERIEELRIQRRVHFHQSIDDAALAELYRGAIALVLPSHYEGFGLPLVEAMACGCPVIAANRTSIPEVVSDAGILIDPDDEESLLAAMDSLLSDAIGRETYGHRGLVRAGQFRWNKVVDRIQVALRPLIH